MWSVVIVCINNVVMLDILAVILSLSLANKVALTTLRCNPFQLKRHINASADGAPPRTSLKELTSVLSRSPSWVSGIGDRE